MFTKKYRTLRVAVFTIRTSNVGSIGNRLKYIPFVISPLSSFLPKVPKELCVGVYILITVSKFDSKNLLIENLSRI